MLGVVDCFDKNVVDEKVDKIFEKIELKPEEKFPSKKRKRDEDIEERPKKAGYIQSFFDYIFGF